MSDSVAIKFVPSRRIASVTEDKVLRRPSSYECDWEKEIGDGKKETYQVKGQLNRDKVLLFLRQNAERPAFVLQIQGGRTDGKKYQWSTFNGAVGNGVRTTKEVFEEFVLEYEANAVLGPTIIPGATQVDISLSAEDNKTIDEFLSHRALGKTLKLVKTIRGSEKLIPEFEEAGKNLMDSNKSAHPLIAQAEQVRCTVIEPFNEVRLNFGDVEAATDDFCCCDDFSAKGIFDCCLCAGRFCTDMCGCLCILDLICGKYKEFVITKEYATALTPADVPSLVASLEQPIVEHIKERGAYELRHIYRYTMVVQK